MADKLRRLAAAGRELEAAAQRAAHARASQAAENRGAAAAEAHGMAAAKEAASATHFGQKLRGGKRSATRKGKKAGRGTRKGKKMFFGLF
jgi:hypothetical protein